MNINMTLLGELILVLIFVMGILFYYLGKRKTHTPKKTVLVGVLLSFIPPLGFIYLVILILKNDIKVRHTCESTS